jgi:hypothetical protein
VSVTSWTRRWLLWLGAFLAIEIPAALNKEPDDTLSEKTWDWFSVRERRRFWLARRIILGLFMAELTAHFLTGGVYPITGGAAVIATALPTSLVIVLSSVFEGGTVNWLKSVWAWLNGKKTAIGATLELIEKVATFLPALLPAWGMDAAHVAGTVGAVTAAIGLLHKLYKWWTGSDPKL